MLRCALCVFGYFVFSMLDASVTHTLEFVLVEPNSGNQKYRIELKGLPDDVTDQLASLSLSTKDAKNIDWNNLFAVYASKSIDATLPPMLGTHLVVDNKIVFIPQFSFDEGVAYTAVFNPKSFLKQHGFDTNIKHTQHNFTIPKKDNYEETNVVEVYPTADVLPENLLRFYIYFSQPMSRGGTYEHLALLDEMGNEVEMPFMELDEELWDPKQQRFTLLFDPGRLKRELKPNLDTGIPMMAGNSYTFLIRKEWLDSHGYELEKEYRKTFRVTESDRKTPKPDKWKITLPKTNTQQALTIEFDEPLDHALASRLIQIKDNDQNVINGEVSFQKEETVYQFTPSSSWITGKYTIHIDPIIEDHAGNSIKKPFDVDITSPKTPRYESEIVIPFNIQL